MLYSVKLHRLAPAPAAASQVLRLAAENAELRRRRHLAGRTPARAASGVDAIDVVRLAVGGEKNDEIRTKVLPSPRFEGVADGHPAGPSTTIP